MATDIVADVSDRATDALFVVFNTPEGRALLERRMGVDPDLVARLGSLGFSSICNVLAAIKTARQQRLGPDDLVVTVATDGAELYATEIDRLIARDFPHGVDEAGVAEAVGRHLLGADTDHMLECTRADRDRIFNLGYYTWVEQQGVSLEAFEARRSPDFWADLRSLPTSWDQRIDEFNARTGALDGL
jgi:cysteine synthase A